MPNRSEPFDENEMGCATDRLEALSSWWVADYASERPTVFATGTCKDDLQKVDGLWTIARRVQSMDSGKARSAKQGGVSGAGS